MLTSHQLALIDRQLQGNSMVQVRATPIRREHKIIGYTLMMECRRLNLCSRVYSLSEFQSLFRLWMDLIAEAS
jgi:hypothetical protein